MRTSPDTGIAAANTESVLVEIGHRLQLTLNGISRLDVDTEANP
ncbi:MAG: hypothetical protein ACR2QK_05820 [Acidimicrobiales bacterium]